MFTVRKVTQCRLAALVLTVAAAACCCNWRPVTSPADVILILATGTPTSADANGFIRGPDFLKHTRKNQSYDVQKRNAKGEEGTVVFALRQRKIQIFKVNQQLVVKDVKRGKL